jgi:hypothetical protein
MEADSPTLPERRQNAIEAVQRLLRITAGHEDAGWMERYEQILDALMEERDEDAFAIAARIPYEIPKEPETGFPLQPRWVVSEGLAEHVQNTLTLLRIHVRYGDRRPLIVPDGPDPDIMSRAPGERPGRRSGGATPRSRSASGSWRYSGPGSSAIAAPRGTRSARRGMVPSRPPDSRALPGWPPANPGRPTAPATGRSPCSCN